MKPILIFISVIMACFFIAGCYSVNYFGDKYPPTENIKLFYREKDVPENVYKVIGRGIVSVDPKFFSEDVIDAVREKAMKVGADAVLIKGFIEIKQEEGSCGSDCHHHDQQIQYELRAEFLKKR